jgi:hypothetical protein
MRYQGQDLTQLWPQNSRTCCAHGFSSLVPGGGYWSGQYADGSLCSPVTVWVTALQNHRSWWIYCRQVPVVYTPELWPCTLDSGVMSLRENQLNWALWAGRERSTHSSLANNITRPFSPVCKISNRGSQVNIRTLLGNQSEGGCKLFHKSLQSN